MLFSLPLFSGNDRWKMWPHYVGQTEYRKLISRFLYINKANTYLPFKVEVVPP